MYDSGRGYYRGRYGYDDGAAYREAPSKPVEEEIKVTAYGMPPEEAPADAKGKSEDKSAPAEGKGFYCKSCEFYEGNSVAFEIKKDDCEIRADVILRKNKCIRIWGRVKSTCDEPVEGAMVKLIKVVFCHGKYQYVGVAHTLTDCKGFYQFDICDKDEKGDYRILVSKSATGKERVIGGYGSCKYFDEDKECDCK